ncbi:hypothetical protein KQX54_001976 [Cotesia glomerata]|uniref:Uncharacterized protein n=1 Tax=Cotesia glomerata TaxID=32391 RepID=A0AAV7IYU5_COTGL|nr:hypothetical protein KQX54_001976 [Cotesia glomerata]
MWLCFSSRNLSGSRNGISNSDLDYESPRPKKQISHSFYGRTQDDDDDDNEETVYDIWGQRTNRRKLRNDVSNEIASTTQCFKDQAANLSQNTDHTSELKHSIQQQFHNIEDKVSKNFKYTRDDNNFIPFQRYSDNMSESKREHIPPTKWSKLLTPDFDTCSNATIRARQTKARLEDLENEIEELAERQAQRERRAVALKAFVNENTSSSQFLERNEQSHTFKCSRNLDGSNIEIERFFFDEYNPRICSEDNMDNNFVLMQRRLKDRATESFEEELAELRRKRRDLEVIFF